MTHLELQLSVVSLLVACSATRPPPSAPTKVFDFSETQLVEVPAPSPPTRPSDKATIRAAIRRVQSRLASCAAAAPHPAGTIEVTLRIAGDDGEAIVDSAQVRAFGDTAIEQCMVDTLMTIEVPPMADAASWSIHHPFVVDANG
jgi:hypothetical protein